VLFQSFQNKYVLKLELGNEKRWDAVRSLRLQQLERFAVTAALKKMAELRIDLGRQASFEFLNLFRNRS
jgi:hypothetical protein